jgi:hypothetical protein
MAHSFQESQLSAARRQTAPTRERRAFPRGSVTPAGAVSGHKLSRKPSPQKRTESESRGAHPSAGVMPGVRVGHGGWLKCRWKITAANSPALSPKSVRRGHRTTRPGTGVLPNPDDDGTPHQAASQAQNRRTLANPAPSRVVAIASSDETS